MKDEEGRTKLYADIAHPINSACREMIQDRVIREYQNELKRSKLPGYISRYDDIDGDAMPPVAHPAVAGHVPPPHVSSPASPAPRSAAPQAGGGHGAASHSTAPHAAGPHLPAAHAPKAPSATPPSDPPRMQAGDESRFGLHRPASGGRSAASAGPRPEGFGAGIFES